MFYDVEYCPQKRQTDSFSYVLKLDSKWEVKKRGEYGFTPAFK